MLKSTKQHKKYWEERDIDWKQAYTSTWNHPHRGLITWMLKTIPFGSLWEVGCGAGANLVRIFKEIPNKQLGGSDINADAIKVCREIFKGGLFHVESGDNLLMSDNSVDVMLSDMTLIYVAPWDICRYLREFKRVGRVAVVLVEFHSRSFWKRWWTRIRTGYHVHDYRYLLEKEGFYDIMIQKIPNEYWPADNNSEFRHIITARI